MTALDTERVATSNMLLELADTFILESHLWAEQGAKHELIRSARLLAEIGRAVLTSADLDKAEAFIAAGEHIIDTVQGARRFFTCLSTPLHVPQPRSAR